MLRESLNGGSSMEASLKVLKNQNASAIQCIEAVRDVRDLDLLEAKRLVVNSSAFSDGQLDIL